MWLVYWMSLQIGEKIVGFVKENISSLVWISFASFFMIPLRFIT